MPPSRTTALRLAATLLGARALQLVVILAFFFLFPPIFSAENYRNNFHWPPAEAPTLASAFQTGDAQHYLYLSQHAYEPGHVSATPRAGGNRERPVRLSSDGISVFHSPALYHQLPRVPKTNPNPGSEKAPEK